MDDEGLNAFLKEFEADIDSMSPEEFEDFCNELGLVDNPYLVKMLPEPRHYFDEQVTEYDFSNDIAGTTDKERIFELALKMHDGSLLQNVVFVGSGNATKDINRVRFRFPDISLLLEFFKEFYSSYAVLFDKYNVRFSINDDDYHLIKPHAIVHMIDSEIDSIDLKRAISRLRLFDSMMDEFIIDVSVSPVRKTKRTGFKKNKGNNKNRM